MAEEVQPVFGSLLHPVTHMELTVLVLVVHTRCLGKHRTSDYVVTLPSGLLSKKGFPASPKARG